MSGENGADAVARVEEALRRPLDASLIATVRKGAAGTQQYLRAADVIAAANEAFGPLGWSYSLDRLEVAVPEWPGRESGGPPQGPLVRAVVTVTVRVGGAEVRRQAVGHGVGQGATPGARLELAEKATETDALKRTLRAFGPRLGLALYLPEELREERGAVEHGEAPARAEDARPVVASPAPAGRLGRANHGSAYDAEAMAAELAGRVEASAARLAATPSPATESETAAMAARLGVAMQGVTDRIAATAPGEALPRETTAALLSFVASCLGSTAAAAEAVRAAGATPRPGATVLSGGQARAVVARLPRLGVAVAAATP